MAHLRVISVCKIHFGRFWPPALESIVGLAGVFNILKCVDSIEQIRRMYKKEKSTREKVDYSDTRNVTDSSAQATSGDVKSL